MSESSWPENVPQLECSRVQQYPKPASAEVQGTNWQRRSCAGRGGLAQRCMLRLCGRFAVPPSSPVSSLLEAHADGLVQIHPLAFRSLWHSDWQVEHREHRLVRCGHRRWVVRQRECRHWKASSIPTHEQHAPVAAGHLVCMTQARLHQRGTPHGCARKRSPWLSFNRQRGCTCSTRAQRPQCYRRSAILQSTEKTTPSLWAAQGCCPRRERNLVEKLHREVRWTRRVHSQVWPGGRVHLVPSAH